MITILDHTLYGKVKKEGTIWIVSPGTSLLITTHLPKHQICKLMSVKCYLNWWNKIEVLKDCNIQRERQTDIGKLEGFLDTKEF